MHIPCVGAIVHDDGGRLLIVQRGHDPQAGFWSVPGGRVEVGETDAEAVMREVLEETGLHVVVGLLLGTAERAAPGGVVYDIRDYACAVSVPGTTPVAGDDAVDVRWVTRAELTHIEVVDGLVETLGQWGVLPH